MTDDSTRRDEKDLALSPAPLADQDQGPRKDEAFAQAEELISDEYNYTPQQYTRLRIKMDLFLIPIMMLTYGLQYSDKVSLSSGVIFGLKTDVHLPGNDYAHLTTWFYMAYLIGQFPLQYLFQRVGLGRGLAFTVICWGVCVTCLGACNTYAELSVVRTLLGLFEAAITPGFLLLIGSWYLRRESTFRSCCFLAMNTFFNIVFGVIIYYIGKTDPAHGWRTINYFLGGITIFDGILVAIFLGTPNEVWWLSKDQKRMAAARIISNGTGHGDTHPWKWSQVIECFKDPQVYSAFIYNFLSNIPNGGFSTFQNLVYTGFGFTPLQTILYGLPNNAISFCLILTTAWFVGRYPRIRFPMALLYEATNTIVFLYIGLSDDDKWKKWASLLFVGTGGVCTFMIWSVVPLNTAGRTKRSVMSAIVFIGYCVGNLAGANIFKASDAPRYLHGLTGCGVSLGINLLNISLLWFYYHFKNNRRDKALLEAGLSVEEREYQNKIANETDKTDWENPHFRYTC